LYIYINFNKLRSCLRSFHHFPISVTIVDCEQVNNILALYRCTMEEDDILNRELILTFCRAWMIGQCKDLKLNWTNHIAYLHKYRVKGRNKKHPLLVEGSFKIELDCCLPRCLSLMQTSISFFLLVIVVLTSLC